MARSGLILARRPFVDTRPATTAVVILSLAAAVLTVLSVTTVTRYLDGSRKTRQSIEDLSHQIEQLEAARAKAEAGWARFDLAGLSDEAEEANALARLRAFSWTRFLTRLETVLPDDFRVVSIQLQKKAEAPGRPSATGARPREDEALPLTLLLVSRDPDSVPRLIRAFYASPYFEAPMPANETGGASGPAEGTQISFQVRYLDKGARP